MQSLATLTDPLAVGEFQVAADACQSGLEQVLEEAKNRPTSTTCHTEAPPCIPTSSETH